MVTKTACRRFFVDKITSYTRRCLVGIHFLQDGALALRRRRKIFSKPLQDLHRLTLDQIDSTANPPLLAGLQVMTEKGIRVVTSVVRAGKDRVSPFPPQSHRVGSLIVLDDNERNFGVDGRAFVCGMQWRDESVRAPLAAGK